MRLPFGLEIGRRPAVVERATALSPIDDNRGGWWRVFESFPGAWQQNVEVDYNTVLSFHAIFACITLIASDIAKLRLKLVEQGPDRIWTETKNPAYSPVLRKPNAYQNRIQFWENWLISKLTTGNTYSLKQRDDRSVVTRLFILDPRRVRVLVSDAGDVFYQLQADNLSEQPRDVTVPAREIIHDRFNCLFHPLVGVSPIFAAGIPAMQGVAIQQDSAVFFTNRSRPSAILIAPKRIGEANAREIKDYWNTNFTGENRGKVAVLGEDMKYQAIATTPEDAQVVEQLKWSAEVVCSTFHVPPYKIGVGTMPAYNNIQALNVEYYSQALQVLIEQAELCMDEGLGMAEGLGTEFDLDGLLRMDSVTQMNVLKEGIGAGLMAPDEGRRKLDLKPVAGGATPYLQQQNYSLAALAKRDAKDDPFATTPTAAPAAAPAPPAGGEAEGEEPEPANDNAEAEAAKALVTILKGLR